MPTGSSFDDSLGSYDLGSLYRLAIDSTVESSVGSSMREVGQQQYRCLLVVECSLIEPRERGIVLASHIGEPISLASRPFCDFPIRGQPVAAPFDKHFELGGCCVPALHNRDQCVGLRQLSR